MLKSLPFCGDLGVLRISGPPCEGLATIVKDFLWFREFRGVLIRQNKVKRNARGLLYSSPSVRLMAMCLLSLVCLLLKHQLELRGFVSRKRWGSLAPDLVLGG